MIPQLAEIALVLVRLDHVASLIVNANHRVTAFDWLGSSVRVAITSAARLPFICWNHPWLTGIVYHDEKSVTWR